MPESYKHNEDNDRWPLIIRLGETAGIKIRLTEANFVKSLIVLLFGHPSLRKTKHTLR